MTHPSCFGLPSVYLPTSPVCGSCTSQARCVPSCHRMLVALSDKLDVTGNLALLERTGLVVLSEATPAIDGATTIEAPAAQAVRVNLAIDAPAQLLLDGLPVRVAKFLKPLIERGQDVKARHSLAAGNNPFDLSTPRWLQFTGARLLGCSFTKAELRALFVREFDWSDATASSRVSIVVSLFPALRIATVSGDRIVCTPSVTASGSNWRIAAWTSSTAASGFWAVRITRFT